MNDNVPRQTAKQRRNNCSRIWHYAVCDLWPSEFISNLVGHFEGDALSENASRAQFLADLALVNNQAEMRKNLPEATLDAIARGIDRHLEKLSFAEVQRSHALYVKGLKCRSRRAAIDAKYLGWFANGRFDTHMGYLIELGQEAA